jgi:very-short-patch-repair endonuclease
MSTRAIDHRLATGEWVRLFQGAYRLAGSECTFEQRVMAGTLAVGADAVASHRAAAALLGMPGAPRWVEITVPRTSRVELTGVIPHRTRLLAPEDVGRLKGIPVTTAGRTIADLAGVYSKGRLGPMLDYAHAQRLVTRAEMEARATGRRHDDVLRELLDERPATPRPMGSEFEACLFGALRDAGLPRPKAQYRVLMTDGSEVFLDFAYPEVMLAIEADSFVWHATLADWQRDRARNGELVELGWSILPITYDLVMRNRREVARRVGRALEARLVTRDLG